jgi:hypothetical protein
VVHKLPTDLRDVLVTNVAALDAWKDITPLARNEFTSAAVSPLSKTGGASVSFPESGCG